MQDTISKLEEIAVKFKKNGKLKKDDGFKAEQLLSTILTDSAYRSAGYSLMQSLPPEVSGNAFYKSWLENENTGDREDMVSGLQDFSEFNGEAGNNRLLELIRLFIPASTVVAICFLITYSDRTTVSATVKPSDKNVTKFRSNLMKKNELLKLPIGEHNLTPREINPIATLVLYSLLPDDQDNPDQGIEWKKFYLDWIAQCRSKPLLPLLNDIEKGTASWPEELQRHGVQLGLLKTVSTSLKKDSGIPLIDLSPSSGGGAVIQETNSGKQEPLHIARKATGKNKARGASEGTHTDPENGRPVAGPRPGDTFDAVLYLDRLGHHIAELEKRIRKSESELMNALLETDRVKQKRYLSETRLVESEQSLRKAETRLQNLEAELAGSRDAIDRLSSELAEAKSKHDNEVSNLLEMIDQRSNQAVQQVKNKLARLMRTDYQDFMQIDNDPMTVELGENLRVQLRNIFRMLSDEEIRL